VRVLVVEDDDGVADALADGLRQHHIRTARAATAAEGLAAAAGADLVLLDMGLPDQDGLWLARQIRKDNDVPIIALTARRSEPLIVAALKAGVDDYVLKPYSLAVLLARVDAVMRRSRAASGTVEAARPLDFGVTLDLQQRQARTAQGTALNLTRKEFDLLAALLWTNGAPATREDLMGDVWDVTWIGASRTLDVHIGTLRGKLGSSATIETVRGIGYRLVPRSDPNHDLHDGNAVT
jgi:DNA-binding response OmpR family regulator